MRQMARMTTFTSEGLYALLADCGRSLADAYEETENEDLFMQSEKAFLACDYLMYVIQQQQMNQTTH